MKTIPVLRFIIAGALCGLAFTARSQVVELRATITAAQETPATSSPATGTAIMLYDVRANTFDLVVSINGMTNPATASHIHEGAVGVSGPVKTGLGAEAVYTRSGSNLSATFRNVINEGDKLKLLQGGAYYNIHSAQFPGGEVRGQLIPRPIRLVANLDLTQEAAAFPALNFAGVNNFGGAVFTYDPVANTINIRHSLYLYNSPFTNSHIHEGAPGVSGPVRTPLGTSATAGAYSSANGYISGTHDAVAFVGDPLLLLTGGMYINYHSQAFPNGQLRGQISVSNEVANTRFGNLAVRGFVGSGDQILIGGLSIAGTEPVRTLITAKGPSLAAFGVTGVLANPRLEVFDSAGRMIASNDDVGTIAPGSDLSRIPGVPTNSVEAALVLVLPPGNYTAQVSAATGTGVALLETYDLRSLSAAGVTLASLDANPPTRAAAVASSAKPASAASAVVELCAAVPLAVTVASR